MTIVSEEEGKGIPDKGKRICKNQNLEEAGVYSGVHGEIGESGSQWSQIVAKLQRALNKIIFFKAVESSM